MIQLQGFDHVAINVRDVERSKQFFMKVLGLSYSFELHPKHVYLACGPSMLALVQDSDQSPTKVRSYVDVGAVNHLSFRVAPEEFDHAVQALQEAQVPIERGPVERLDEGSRSIYFFDPDGYRLEITAWTREK